MQRRTNWKSFNFESRHALILTWRPLEMRRSVPAIRLFGQREPIGPLPTQCFASVQTSIREVEQYLGNVLSIAPDGHAVGGGAGRFADRPLGPMSRSARTQVEHVPPRWRSDDGTTNGELVIPRKQGWKSELKSFGR